jgi:hypothetical protein
MYIGQYLPEDPAFSTGSRRIFKCLINKHKTRCNRGLNKDFKTVLVSTMS